jgi:hypothetical protein
MAQIGREWTTVRLVLAAMLMCAAGMPLHAAQPYVTDDARLVPAGACQLEVGRRMLRGGHEVWMLPGCNPFGNAELTLGMNRTHLVDSERASDFVMQAKGLFRELKPDDFGLAWVANLEAHRHPRPGEKRIGSAYVAGIYSHSFLDDRLFAHANLGARRLRDVGATAVAWALAGEYNFTERTALIAEIADTTRSPRRYQAGLWFALVPDRVELDVSVGGEAHGFRRTRHWTAGIRIITPALLK